MAVVSGPGRPGAHPRNICNGSMVVQAASLQYSDPATPSPPTLGFSFTLLFPLPGATHRAAVPLVPRRWSEDRVVLRRQPDAPHHRLQRRLRCVPVYQVITHMSLRYCDAQQRELLLPQTTLKKAAPTTSTETNTHIVTPVSSQLSVH